MKFKIIFCLSLLCIFSNYSYAEKKAPSELVWDEKPKGETSSCYGDVCFHNEQNKNGYFPGSSERMNKQEQRLLIDPHSKHDRNDDSRRMEYRGTIKLN